MRGGSTPSRRGCASAAVTLFFSFPRVPWPYAYGPRYRLVHALIQVCLLPTLSRYLDQTRLRYNRVESGNWKRPIRRTTSTPFVDIPPKYGKIHLHDTSEPSASSRHLLVELGALRQTRGLPEVVRHENLRPSLRCPCQQFRTVDFDETLEERQAQE